MENQENFSLIIDMFKQINNSISSLSQNQVLICEKIKLLDEKMDTKFATMDAKIDKLRQDMDTRFAAMDAKINKLRQDMDTKIDKLRQDMDIKIDKLRQDMDINFNFVRKDISNLKCDIDIVYDLEIKSSKQLKQLM